jgi:ELWxxDGT repeat protein
LTAVGNKLFFDVNDSSAQSGLWVSDGTAAGTVHLSQAVPYNAPDMADVNGTLYFLNVEPTTSGTWQSGGLWRSDGTAAGTALVTPITGADHLANVNGTLFFTVNTASASELWKSDGTATGTVRVMTLPPATSPAANLINIHGTLFFTADDAAGGLELWQSNGTAAGTVMVKDIAHAAGTEQLANVNGVLYLAVNDGQGFEIWKADPAPAATALRVSAVPVTATEGEAFTGTVATFTDPAGAQPVGTYNAQVDWGDGSSSTGTVASTPQGLVIAGSHTYAEEGTYTVTVSIAKGGGLPNQVTATMKVADAPIWAGREFLRTTEGKAFTGTVATITDGNPLGKAGDFTATIKWGDGTTSTGTVAQTGPGKFAVQGVHTYAVAGTYTVTVSAKDAGGSAATALSTFLVDDAPLTAVPPKTLATVTPAVPSQTVVAGFTDANPLATAGQFVATIDWGDGTTSAGAVSRAAGQPFFVVAGSHRYAKPGSYKVTTTIRDAGGSKLTAMLTLPK